MTKIFEYSDYKKFILSLEKNDPRYQRGFRSKLASFVGCQNSFVSQVLTGPLNFGLEQGLKIAQFLGLTASEQKCFLLLVELARAGTKDLKQHFIRELSELREAQLNLSRRLPTRKTLTHEEQSLYYSRSLYATVHMLVTIPQFRSLSAISRALRTSEEELRTVLDFLINAGLVKAQEGEFVPGEATLHLNRDTPQIIQHHTNWRVAAINALRTGQSSNLHYSTVSSLSHEDAEKLRTRMVETIEVYVATVAPSKEEALVCFNLDFFRIA